LGQILGKKKPAIEPALIVLVDGYSDGSIMLDSQKIAKIKVQAASAL